MIKKLLVAFLCLGGIAVSGLAQGSQTVRPRVAATPTPQAPIIQNDPQQQTTDRRPPVFGGQNRPGTTTTTQPAGKPVDDPDEVIKVETNLVTMPVSVLDREGRFVSGLTQKDFRIFENGIEQKVDYFQSVEQPFTVILMIDVSPSTAYQIDEIHDAAISFVDQLRPNDKVMVMSFDDRVHVLTEPTNNRNQLRNAILEAQFGDGTSLYEAVDFAINQELKRIQGRKAVVLFTDGVDTTSRRANYQSTLADVEEVDALFYPVRYDTQQRGFGGGGYGGGGRRGGGGYGYPQRRRGGGGLGDIVGIILGGGQFPPVTMGGGAAGSSPEEYETGKRYLEQLAQNSGGRAFEAQGNLDAAFSGIAEELRRQYSLGYYPDAVGQKGERKQIKVRVMRPNLVVRAKSSYIVGENGTRVAGK
jgi:VWFA-related protein